MYFLLKMWIVHCYVSLPEGTIFLHFILPVLPQSDRFLGDGESTHVFSLDCCDFQPWKSNAPTLPKTHISCQKVRFFIKDRVIIIGSWWVAHTPVASENHIFDMSKKSTPLNSIGGCGLDRTGSFSWWCLKDFYQQQLVG